MDSTNAPRRTLAEALDAAADRLVEADYAQAQMTPREQAEAAWTPTSSYTVDELEDRIRTRRGMGPRKRGGRSEDRP